MRICSHSSIVRYYDQSIERLECVSKAVCEILGEATVSISWTMKQVGGSQGRIIISFVGDYMYLFLVLYSVKFQKKCQAMRLKAKYTLFLTDRLF